jgi:hypothetical protein
LQLVGVEITDEGVDSNLGAKNHRNYAKIEVVNRSVFENLVKNNAYQCLHLKLKVKCRVKHALENTSIKQ